MNEEVIKNLDKIAQKFGIVIDWTNQNVVPYLQDLMERFIKFQNSCAILWIIISVISLIVLLIIISNYFKLIKEKYKEDKHYDITMDDPIIFTISIILICAIIGSIIILLCNIFGLVQNIYLPELTLIKYLNNMNV